MRIHRHLVPLFLWLAGSALGQAADPVLRNWGMGAFRGMDTSLTVQSLSATDADTTAASLVSDLLIRDPASSRQESRE